MRLQDIAAEAAKHIQDSGPIYHEFHADHFIKEPWNAYSSLFFLVPVAFWIWKLRGKYRQHRIMVVLLPLLFLNGVGSTLYHAFRSSDLLMHLDWMPAFFMGLTLSGWLWNRVLNSLWKAILVLISFYGTGILAVGLLTPMLGQAAGNVGYFFIGACFLLPTVVNLVRTGFYKWHLIALSIVFLALALMWRSLDYPNPNPFPGFMPQGTHFLWHITSALAVFTLGYYVYFLNEKKPAELQPAKQPL